MSIQANKESYRNLKWAFASFIPQALLGTFILAKTIALKFSTTPVDPFFQTQMLELSLINMLVVTASAINCNRRINETFSR